MMRPEIGPWTVSGGRERGEGKGGGGREGGRRKGGREGGTGSLCVY